MKKEATEAFHRPPENLNCAQAVLHAYQLKTGDKNIPVDSFRPFGGGRAPGGLCGALHTACELVPDKRAELIAAFEKRAGSTLCKAIKLEHKYPCVTCVSDGAELLEQALPAKPQA